MRFGNRGRLGSGRVRYRFERRTGDTLAHHSIGQFALLVGGRVLEQYRRSFGQRARSFARSRSFSKSRSSPLKSSGLAGGSNWSGSVTGRAAVAVGAVVGPMPT